MTTRASSPWRWANTVIALGLAATLVGCGSLDLGGDAGLPGAAASPSALPGSAVETEPAQSPAQLAAAECFPGTWQLDNGSMVSLLAASGILASDSIEGISLVIAQADGTASVEHIGLRYVLKAPPNPILGDQAPSTTTIMRDSSHTASYLIDDDGTVVLTVEEQEAPMSLTCQGSQLREWVEDFGGEILYHRRG